jgi:peroxiredoxin family protein
MTSLALIISGGSLNQFVQVITLLMAAVHSDLSVRVLFRDEAVLRLTAEGLGQIALSPAFREQASAYLDRLKQHDLVDLRRLLADIKASGDVKLYACSSSLALAGIRREALIAEVDDVRGVPAFLLEDVATADRVFTF